MGWSPLPACPTLPRLPSPAWEGEEHHCCDQKLILTTNQTSKQPSTHIKQMKIFARRGSGSYKGAYESDDDIAAKGQNNGWAMLSSFLRSQFVPSLHIMESWMAIFINTYVPGNLATSVCQAESHPVLRSIFVRPKRSEIIFCCSSLCKDTKHQLILLYRRRRSSGSWSSSSWTRRTSTTRPGDWKTRMIVLTRQRW